MDDYIGQFIIIAFAFVIGAVAVFLMYGFVSTIAVYSATGYLGYNPFRYFVLFPSKLNAEQMEILEKKFRYYKLLSKDLKEVFRHRLARFLKTKKFETRNGLVLSEDMKVLISASAIQLTFGLSEYRFSFFDRVVIYPGVFYSKVNKSYHKGEVHAQGLIVFSWIDFIDGYIDPDDNFNLGLHEFAHALFVCYQRNRFDDPVLEKYYGEWREVGDREFFLQRKTNKGYFRPYARTNLMEFFAVAVEYFFESPTTFKQSLPELYKTLSVMLGQDPVRMYK